MSGVEHQATVDKGLKMKIKRTKNVGPGSGNASTGVNKQNENKQEAKPSSSSETTNGTPADRTKSSIINSDKSPKFKGVHRKDKMKEKMGKNPGEPSTSSSSLFSVSTSLDAAFSQVSLEPKPGEVASSNKKDNPLADPYEFNAKDEDHCFGLPVKKMKVEKSESLSLSSSAGPSQHVGVGTDMCSIGIATEPECLGPCEPGTSVNLEGIVWHETENGMLVVNVTWRGKTYVGTLLDATRHDWAPPRLNNDSPVSDFETRTPKGRAKRGRASATPVNERDMRKLRKGRRGSNTFQAPPSPAKSDISSSSGVKRKSRPADIDLSAIDNVRSSKRSRSCSRGTPGTERATPGTESPVLELIECPEPNCNKKYKHLNGLRYHQSHAHQGGEGGDMDDELKDVENEDSILDELDSTTVDSCDMSNTTIKDDGILNFDTEKKIEKDDDSNLDGESNQSVRSNSPLKVTPVVAQKKDITSTISTTGAHKSLNVSGHVFQVVSHHSNVSSVAPAIQTPTVSSEMLPVTTSQQVPITATVVATSSVQITMPITVTAMTTVSQSPDTKSDTLKGDKNSDKLRQQKSGTRPIMPSHMISLSSSVSVTQSNVAPVTAHASNVTQLKPIQPKPASMKADNKNININSPFAGLKELKRKEMKEKKRLKEKEMMTGPVMSPSLPKTGTSKFDQNKEQSSVIKVTPIAPKPFKSDHGDKLTTAPNVGVVAAVVQPLHKGMDLSTQRHVEPPSVLKVSSPLTISATDSCKSNINDDVQSPAYSDISDANEAASPAAAPQSDSPQKNKDNLQMSNKNKELTNASNESMSNENSQVASYGMYGSYYGQQPYLLSSLSPSAQGSQSLNSPKITVDQGSDSSKLQNADLKIKREPVSKDDKRDDIENKLDARSLSEQEYQHMQQQKWFQQQMYALQSLPPHAQYEYMAAYAPYLDPGYHMHLMSTNLPYRQHFEKVMEDQKRMQTDSVRKESDISNRFGDRPGHHSISASTSSDSAPNLVTDDSQGKTSTYLDISYSNRDSDKKRHSVESMVDRDNKDRKMKEKQNENHQILKENIDLKAQMDQCRPYDQNYDSFRMSSASTSHEKTSEEQARRHQMFQQQKMIEQQKREEQKKVESSKSDSARPADMSSKPPSGVSKSRDHGGDGGRSELPKKDSENRNKDVIKSETSESKNSEKTRNPSSERGRGIETQSDRPRNVENPSTERVRNSGELPKSKPGLVNKASSPTPSMSASPYLQYPSYQYMQSPPYGHSQMPFEPNHPMYHGMNPALNPAMMYPPGAYLHPSQLGYRVGNAVEVEDKGKLGGSGKKIGLEDEKSKLSSSDSPGHGPLYYGGGHKIHELQEKRLSSPHRSSPVPSKGGDTSVVPPTSLASKVGDKSREFSNSPPTQRHVHTHHHTHVLETAYPVYPLSTMFPGSSPQTTSPSLQPHPSFPPGK